MKTTKSRISVTVGLGLERFLTTGGVASSNTSTRVDVMAARYWEITSDLVPKRWSEADWEIIAQIVRDNPPVFGALQSISISHRLRQLAHGSPREQELSALAYRFEQLRLAEQMAVIERAEQIIAAQSRVAPQSP